jgi:Fe-S-cluster containining protein
MESRLAQKVRDARHRLDRENDHCLAAQAGRGGRIWCGRSCSDCCTLAVFTTFPEARQIAAEITPELAVAVRSQVDRIRTFLPQASDFKSFLRLHRRPGGTCPFLGGDGACNIYPLRPLACRALLSTRNNAWCAVDFSELHSGEKQAYLSSLDPAVVAVPTHYLAAPQQLARELEEQILSAMGFRYGFSLSGLLPVLVHLILEFGLNDALGAGYGSTLARLRESGLAHPFLVILNE